MSEYENQCGLWKKDGNNGPYYSGRITVGGQEFYANLYRNDRKTSDKSPDLNLKLKPVEGAASKSQMERSVVQSAPPATDDFQDSEIPF